MTNKLVVLRQFCRFRQPYQAQAFVPDRMWAPQSAESIFAPHVFSDEEIGLIIAATAQINTSPRSRRWLVHDCSDPSPGAFLFADDHRHQRRVKNVSHNLRVLFRRCRLDR